VTPEERRRKLEEIAARVVDRLDREWPAQDAHINDLEDLAEKVGRELMREVTAELIHERARRKAENERACPRCHRPARFAGYAQREYGTLHGRLPVCRPYYFCAPCEHGHAPLDTRWGLGPGGTTPSVQAIVADLATDPSYVRLPYRLARLRFPFTVCVKTAERIAQHVGKAIQADPPGITTPATRPLAVAVDGVIVPTHAGGKEARAGVVYEPDWEAGRTPDECAGLRKEYVGTFESREALVEEVCRRVERRRPTAETPVAALGDGAHWIWEGYAQHLPHRVEILDFYHACEHLTAVATARFGAGTPAGAAWVRAMKQEWLEIGPWELLRDLEAWEPDTAAAREVRRQELGYFRNHQARMRYPAYLRRGLPIGSGAVEGACKHLVGARFKGAGMRWKLPTAEPVVHLRAAVLTKPDIDLRAYVS
jgi:AcrR family transcriptional regulator